MKKYTSTTATIRPATSADARAIALLARGLLEHEQSFNNALAELTPWAGGEAEIRKQMLRPNVIFFIAENWGEIIGYIKIQTHGLPPSRRDIGTLRWVVDRLEQCLRAGIDFFLRRPRPNTDAVGGYIAGIYVLLEARRSNVGRLLVEAAESWLRQKGIDTSELHVLCANEEAVRFWKDVGYEPLAIGMRKKLETP